MNARRFIVAAAVIVAMLAGSLSASAAPRDGSSCTTWVHGIDVSNNHGTIDWAQVPSSGVAFAITLLSIGIGRRFRQGSTAGGGRRCGRRRIGARRTVHTRSALALLLLFTHLVDQILAQIVIGHAELLPPVGQHFVDLTRIRTQAHEVK